MTERQLRNAHNTLLDVVEVLERYRENETDILTQFKLDSLIERVGITNELVWDEICKSENGVLAA